MPIASCFMLVFLFSISDSVLIVIWGQPDQWNSCDKYVTSDWEDCMFECESNETCIFTYLNSSICYLCQVGEIISIKNGKDTQLDKVAFKANVSSCAESPSTEYTTSEYTITYSNGYWNFSYATQTTEISINETTTLITTATPSTTTTTKKTTTTTTTKAPTTTIIGWECPSGWTYFSRQMGKWCMQVFAGVVNQTTATSKCVSNGAVLSGPENSAEQTWIISQGVAIIQNVSGNPGQGYLWVGAARLTTCRGTNTNATSCLPWVNNAYEWTDGFTSLKKMMLWLSTQPDYYLESENCVQMMIVNKTDPGTAISGYLNDCSCSKSTATYQDGYMRGYVCGLRATAITM